MYKNMENCCIISWKAKLSLARLLCYGNIYRTWTNTWESPPSPEIGTYWRNITKFCTTYLFTDSLFINQQLQGMRFRPHINVEAAKIWWSTYTFIKFPSIKFTFNTYVPWGRNWNGCRRALESSPGLYTSTHADIYHRNKFKAVRFFSEARKKVTKIDLRKFIFIKMMLI